YGGLPVLCSLAALYAVMLLPWSQPIWRILPRIWMAEFPWRSLYILNLALAMALVAALRGAKARAAWAALAAVFWLGAGGAILAGAPWEPDEIHEMIAAASSPEGFEGVVDEFLPAGVDPDNLEADAPRFVAVDEAGEAQEVEGLKIGGVLWNAEEKRFTVESDEPARLRLHLVNYPAWRATVDGARVTPQTDSGTGQMVIAVPAGHSEVRVWFGHTADRTAGPIVSLAALTFVVFL